MLYPWNTNLKMKAPLSVEYDAAPTYMKAIIA